MSQDLLAAFGGTEEPNKSQPRLNPNNQSSSFFDDFGKSIQVASQDEAGDDEWGDFEGPAVEEQGIEKRLEILRLGETKVPPATIPEAPMSAELIKEGGGNQPTKQAQPEPRDPNVLFDATEDLPSEEEDDDDFGEFEGTETTEVPAKPTAPKPVEIDLLGLGDESGASHVQSWSPQKAPSQPTSSLLDLEDLLGSTSPPQVGSQSRTSSRASEIPASKIGTQTTIKTSDRPNTAALSFSRTGVERRPSPSADPKLTVEDDEPWEDFSTSTNTISPPPALSSPLPFNMPKASTPPPEPPNAQPPTNIPPPAILLSNFPTLLTDLSTSFFGPLSAQPADVRHRIYTSPDAILYLKSYLSLSVVCARIIAGRKSRWKRDTRLSQSMRIGQASGSKGGMKVTSIDRAETAREDREVADVLKAWQGQVGRLRGAVAEVRKAAVGTERENGVDGLVVPEMKEVMAVKSVGSKEGGVAGVRACALCGLKRDERVQKVDGEVFDGFGEWWVEGWEMHRACRNFWLEHEGKLRQR